MLVAALAAMMLATTASLVLIETRAARMSAGENLRLALAHAHAEALLAEAMVQLDAGVSTPRQGVILSRDEGQVWRQDAGGLLDVNTAEPALLAALMVAAGLTSDQAATLADRIADWRDEDNLRRVRGAEAADYADADLAAPGNRPFITETEIVAVLGMDADLAKCLTPWLTTYSAAPTIDPGAAPERLRAAFGLERGALSETAPLGRVIALSADAPISPHAVLRRTLWLRLTGDARDPVFIHRAAEELAPRGEPREHFPCAPVKAAS